MDTSFYDKQQALLEKQMQELKDDMAAIKKGYPNCSSL